MMNFINIRPVLLAGLLGMTPLTSFGFVSITIAPPALLVYEQPFCPADGYIWVPGYWAYGDDGYYWVPGVWVEPPRMGVLWTPGYYGFEGDAYTWHEGYWGPHVGFYGGINYGFGYGGVGFVGGEWQENGYRYNTAVTNVNTTVVRNTYANKTVVNKATANSRASFNGPGGGTARPTAEEEKALHEQHMPATTAQRKHEQSALHDRNQLASANNGRPTTTALTSVKGHEPRNTNANVSGQPAAHETPNLEKRETKPGEGQANRPPNENRLKSEEQTKANRQEENLRKNAPTEPNVPHEQAPSQTNRETNKPAEKKPASKPHEEKRSSGKEEKKE